MESAKETVRVVGISSTSHSNLRINSSLHVVAVSPSLVSPSGCSHGKIPRCCESRLDASVMLPTVSFREILALHYHGRSIGRLDSRHNNRRYPLGREIALESRFDRRSGKMGRSRTNQRSVNCLSTTETSGRSRTALTTWTKPSFVAFGKLSRSPPSK